MKRIILADNQPFFLAGMAKLIAAEDEMRIVAQCADIEHLLRAIRAFRSSVVVAASSLIPNLHALAGSIRATGGKLIVIAGNTDSAKVYATNEVRGVVFRMTSGQNLVACIKAVASGEIYCQDKAQFQSTDDNETDRAGERVRDSLTRREMKVVGLIVLGYKNKEIAKKLGTSEQVVKNYLRSIFDKAGVSDRVSLALFTLDHNDLGQAAARAITSA